MSVTADEIAGSTVEDFPYDAVVDEFHRVGKHFVEKDLLNALDQARSKLPGSGSEKAELLRGFLDTALDKWDGRYEYQTYLSLSLLPLPTTLDGPADVDAAARQRDRLVLQLVADTLRFEIDASTGRTTMLPQLRPDPALLGKRYRLGLRSVAPILRRLEEAEGSLGDGFPAGAETTEEPERAARRLCERVEAGSSAGERQILRLSNLPVYVVHDEYLFIRVLQSFEATFALLAVHLSAAVEGVSQSAYADAARELVACTAVLGEAAPLFSMLATMSVESFLTFRIYTEGASAIQSRNYKLVESICRSPDPHRLDSSAYRSVPEVRQQVLSGRPNIDDALRAAKAAGRLTEAEQAGLEQVMHGFADALQQWRQTHYRLAVRMLGDRTGTGYTEGTPYLDRVREHPIFRGAGGAGRPRAN
jgi:tryptophan 2,3-dioxygenase